MAKPNLTAERVRELLHYDHETGAFSWLTKRCGRAMPGTIVSAPSNGGYLRLMVDGLRVQQHRLAWLHAHGFWPQYFIDHIDGNKQNNALRNLRDVSKAVNAQNQKKSKVSNKSSGILGVHAHGGKWQSSICKDGLSFHLGTFASQEEAQSAYLNAKRNLHEGCTI